MDLKLITKFGKWKKIIRDEKNKKRNFPLVFLFFVLFYFCLFVFCQSKVLVHLPQNHLRDLENADSWAPPKGH